MDLVTGATGFIGQRLLARLLREGREVRALLRHGSVPAAEVVRADLGDPAGLAAACAGVERVFHCAGHAHAFASLSGADSEEHWRVNFAGTRNLVEAAGRAGVQRFVFLSTVKAMAEPGESCADEMFPGLPATAYGQSKRAAEGAVLAAGSRHRMHVVNLRLAMVYGAAGRGNLERMGRLVRRGWFPPLPETANRRSLVHVDDVVDAICLVAGDDRAGGRTYNIVGPDSPSGRHLFDTIRQAAGLPPLQWAMPESVLRVAACCGDSFERLLGRRLPLDSEALNRLLGSAWYSGALIERELGWRPRVSLEQGLKEMFGI